MRLKKSSPAKQNQTALNWDAPTLVAGVDEAGRGPLAGPVFAAAVILDDLQPIKGLADSKKLTAKQREKLYDDIRAKALCFCVAQASVAEIDQLNILQATMLAMQRAISGLRLKPGKALIDGNRLPVIDVMAEAIVKGDAKVPSISAASIWPKLNVIYGASQSMIYTQNTDSPNTKGMALPFTCGRFKPTGRRHFIARHLRL